MLVARVHSWRVRPSSDYTKVERNHRRLFHLSPVSECVGLANLVFQLLLLLVQRNQTKIPFIAVGDALNFKIPK